MTPRVAIIVVTYESGDVIEACLRRLSDAATELDRTVVVVDNASTDDTVECVQAFGGVVLLLSAKNLGWAGGNVLGIDWARRHDCSHVAILNPDVLVRDRWLDAAIEVIGRCDGHAAVDFVLDEEGDARSSVESVPGRYGPAPGAGPVRPDEAVRVGALTGAAMVVPMSVVEQVGGPDTEYFLYCEDLDWSWRMEAAGVALLRVPVVLRHFGEASSGSDSRRLLRSWLSIRNTIRLRIKLRPHELSSWMKTLIAYAVKPGVRPLDDAEARLRPYGPFRNLALVFLAGAWNLVHLPQTLAARKRERLPR